MNKHRFRPEPATDKALGDHQKQTVGLQIEVLGVCERVILVDHDWGTALAFDWARRHSDAMEGIVFMEGVVEVTSWDVMSEVARKSFQATRSSGGDGAWTSHAPGRFS